MKREELIAMGISEENVEKIMAEHAKVVQSANAKAAELKAKADSADELQKKVDELEAGNLSEIDKANKALETANKKIAELEKAQAVATQRSNAASKFNISAEQALKIIGDDGTLDYDALGKIISEKETAAAQAKEQEIANNSTNPGGGSVGGNKEEKTEAEKTAETIGKTLAGTNETAKSIVENYL